MMNQDTAFARQAIQELAARYSDALNQRNWQSFNSCWMWGSIYKVQGPTSIEKKGLEAISAEAKAALGQMETFFNVTHPGVIEVFGREAKARFPVTEYRHLIGAGRRTTVLGFYEDELKWAMTGQWVFEKRTFTVVYSEDTAPKIGPVQVRA